MISISVLALLLLAITKTSGYGFCDDLEECSCFLNDELKLVVDCNGRDLDEFPERIPDEVQIIIFSNNAFRELPQELNLYTLLEEINFSGNHIKQIHSNALDKLETLKKLDLSKNNITKLSDINVAKVFIPAKELVELNLSYNPISSLQINEDGVIHSRTLQSLSLSGCEIHSFVSSHFFKHMPKLEFLDISHNPLKLMNNLSSDSLTHLDASHCQLSYISMYALSDLKKLVKLNLSWNHRLLLSWNNYAVKSDTLKDLDISYCNMEKVSIEGFPNLINLVARGNLIRELTDKCFSKNVFLENINLSANAISSVDWNVFKLLQDLRHIDLSWNVIPALDSKTFSSNDQLKTINLSRNHLSKLDSMMAPSVDYLDVSWCEIQGITKDSLSSMPKLTDLDLSHNLISEIPDRLIAPKLRMLDLTFCRIKSLRNETLQEVPKLTRLLLAGNRFTTPFRESYFASNPDLNELDLSDNPWRCDCSSESFKMFYYFLRPKIDDHRSLKCETPEELAGRTWSGACNAHWNPNAIPVSRTEKIWMFLMVTMLSFAGCMCVVMSIRRAILARAEAARAEEQRVADEMRQREQQQRLRHESEAQRNAPDPRELVSPPCYEDALLMPRLDGSFASLGHLPSGSRDNLRNKVKNRTQSEANILKPSPRARHIRQVEIAPPHETQSAVDLTAAAAIDASSESTESSRNSQQSAVVIVVEDETTAPNPAPTPAPTSTPVLAAPTRRPIPKSPPPKYKERHSDTSSDSIEEIVERVRRESDL